MEWILHRNRTHKKLRPSRFPNGKLTTTFNGWGKSKEAFDTACGVSGWTLHDLRRTYATKLAALKVPPHIVERLLNHKFGSIQNRTDGTVSAVAEVYNRHLYIGEMREAVKVWEAYLAGLLNPTSLQGGPDEFKRKDNRQRAFCTGTGLGCSFKTAAMYSENNV